MVKMGGNGSYSICTAATASRTLFLSGWASSTIGLVAMIHLAVSKAGLIGKDELNMILAGNIGSGDDGKFAPVDAAVKPD